MADTEMSLEESFAKLNDIIHLLENQELGLEDSFQLYHDGMKLLKDCKDSIDRVEKKLMILEEKELQEESD
jgi:Exonuclease VII small subunit